HARSARLPARGPPPLPPPTRHRRGDGARGVVCAGCGPAEASEGCRKLRVSVTRSSTEDRKSVRVPVDQLLGTVESMSAISVGQAVVLGIVEGVTEFLPVSSTGHLKIAQGLMGIPVDDRSVVGFTAVVQVGAIAAVFVYFFKD